MALLALGRPFVLSFVIWPERERAGCYRLARLSMSCGCPRVGVFVDAQGLGLDGSETPERIESDARLLQELESLRRQASIAMGLTPDEERAAASRSVPFIGMIARVKPWVSRAGAQLGSDDADLSVRMLSSGNAHRAIPVTSALCVAVACRTPETLPSDLCRTPVGPLRIGHPSGVIVVEAEQDGVSGEVRHASVYRTTRRLFQGEVLYRSTQTGVPCFSTSDSAVRKPEDVRRRS
jgi:2-methylaconitate cis-trans-isomerase PrpF